jgi:hypothetical protein
MEEKSKGVYYAKVKIIDKTTLKKEWEDEGNAENVLFRAIEFIGVKDGDSIYKRIIDYLVKDYEAFDKSLARLFLKKR